MDTLLWVVYIIMIVLFNFLGISILRRGPKKRINQMFFLFLFTVALGLIVNIIYRAIDDPALNVILNEVTIFISSISAIFIFLFNLIILKSDKIVSDKIKITLIIVWIALCSVLFFIEPSVEPFCDDPLLCTNSNPIWNTPFAVYGLVIGQIVFSLTLYVNGQIYKRFEHDELKKKYIYTIISTVVFDWVLVGNFLNNWLNLPLLRTIFPITALLAIPACILLYIGVKRES